MKTIFTIVTLLFSVVLSAQTIESFSIDSGGASSENGIHILYTIGEVNVHEYGVGNISLSEGFINGNVTSSTLGVEDEDMLDQKISIYPNPASTYINIKSQTPITSVEIFDAIGRKVITKNETTKLRVDLLTSGVYVLKVISENEIFTKRIIIK